MNQLREKLARGERVYGSLVSLTDPALCEIMGRVGYDCVWIDLEHTYISERDTLCHLNAARASGIASLVRVPQHDLTVTKRVLEMGPDAILFPMVRSAAEARELLRHSPGTIQKRRHLASVGGHTFEVDCFYGENEGLVMAEVELASADEEFERPAWLGEEVTGDVRYYNSQLLKNPYTKWHE